MYAVIDLETTGGKPSFHKITEVAVVIHDGSKVLDSFSTLINPEQRIPYFITQLTGITENMVASAPRFCEVAKKIVEMTEGKIFVAHNARFDYSFLKREFADLGYTFTRKTLCTVRAARKILPGLPTYRLGALTKELGIEHGQAHRAMGDAMATAELLSLLVDRAGQLNESQLISDESNHGLLPPGLDEKKLADLPDSTGVYYFHDEKGKVIYVGKSANIRQRVQSHFRADHKSTKPLKFKNEICDISFEKTGDELVALLRESDQIKNLRPTYNRTLKRKRMLYGLFATPSDQGYLLLRVRTIRKGETPILRFGSRYAGERLIQRACDKYFLCLRYCFESKYSLSCRHLTGNACLGACEGKELPEKYNFRVKKFIDAHRFHLDSFLVLGKGRQSGEESFVLVESNEVKGFGYLLEGNRDFRSALIECEEHPDSRKILLAQLRKIPRTRLVALTSLQDS